MKDWLKAKFALFAIALIWGSLILSMLPLMVVAAIHDRLVYIPHRQHSWLYNILIAQDILTNTVLGGYFRTTVSSELGRLKQRGSTSGTLAANVVDFLFLIAVGERNHCINAIENEDLHFHNPQKALGGFVMFIVSRVLEHIAVYYIFFKGAS